MDVFTNQKSGKKTEIVRQKHSRDSVKNLLEHSRRLFLWLSRQRAHTDTHSHYSR